MEEDIKLLEEMKANCIKGMMKGAIYTDEKAERKALAIDNIIKGYRELEKEYERVRAGRNWLSERISAQIATPEIFDKILEENYIPKSKIKEKIEELNNYDSEFCQRVINHNEHTLTEFVQNILQELMEDK